MSQTAAADVVIFGGGIAGLWLLNRLRQKGLSVFLFEIKALGGEQTGKSQGIIHGGMKYALQGSLTADAKALSAMPKRWQDCLTGQGDIDLSGVQILSKQHYLFSPNRFTSKVGGFLASATLMSQVLPLQRHDYPVIFQDPGFKGDVFALDEQVIDVASLIRELVKVHQDAIFKIDEVDEQGFEFDDEGKLFNVTLRFAGQTLKIAAQQFVLAAGAGNETLLKPFNTRTIEMQRRPLHMVVVKPKYDFSLFAHCIGLSSRPRLTITTHRMRDGEPIWYLGGMLAEEGVVRNEATQIQVAKKELMTLFPWLDFNHADFASFYIDRAEPKQKNGLKPENCYMKTINNVVVAWPTKLALAPLLADEIIAHFDAAQLSPLWSDARELRIWPMPPMAQAMWEKLFCKNAA